MEYYRSVEESFERRENLRAYIVIELLKGKGWEEVFGFGILGFFF